MKPPVFESKSKADAKTKHPVVSDASDEENDTDAESESESLDPSRLRFVGDVDLDEKDEPLLKESKRRFVLFPIQYNEVIFSLLDASFAY